MLRGAAVERRRSDGALVARRPSDAAARDDASGSYDETGGGALVDAIADELMRADEVDTDTAPRSGRGLRARADRGAGGAGRGASCACVAAHRRGVVCRPSVYLGQLESLTRRAPSRSLARAPSLAVASTPLSLRRATPRCGFVARRRSFDARRRRFDARRSNALPLRRRTPPPLRREGRWRRAFRRWDGNGDGRLSLDEVCARARFPLFSRHAWPVSVAAFTH